MRRVELTGRPIVGPAHRDPGEAATCPDWEQSDRATVFSKWTARAAFWWVSPP